MYYRNYFRVIVAGGGTGIGTVFCGEQLNHTNGEVIYLDFSRASMQVAQKRARIRRLANIIWVQSWIESIRYLGMGLFGQLQCSGVIHHLKNPILGLNILKDILSAYGGMEVMIYATYGRTSVYQMQDLLKMVNNDECELEKEIKTADHILSVIPTSNWFVINPVVSDHKDGNIGVYDLFLHNRDVSYSIFTLFQWIAQAGVNFVDFTDHITRCVLSTKYVVHDYNLYIKISNLDIIQQWSIAEIMRGDIIMHSFYTSKIENSEAALRDSSNLIYIYGAPHGFRAALINKTNRRTLGNHTHFFAWLSEHYVLLSLTNSSIIPFDRDVGMTSRSAIPLSWKLNRFNMFLINKLLESNRGLSLKSTYSEYRRKTNSNSSNHELYKLADFFYISTKHTGLFRLRKQYVTSFPKTAFVHYFTIK